MFNGLHFSHVWVLKQYIYIYNRFAKFCANLPNQKDIFTVFQQPLSSSKSSNLDGDPHNESCHEQLPHGCMIQK